MMSSWSAEDLAEVRRMVGDISDGRFNAILSLNPGFKEIEEAVFWADGRADREGNGEWPLTGKSGEIFEILTADVEEEIGPH